MKYLSLFIILLILQGHCFAQKTAIMYDSERPVTEDSVDIVKYQYNLPGSDLYKWRYSADLNAPLVMTKRKARK